MNKQNTQVQYYNRKTKQVENELIFGEQIMRWFYENQIGNTLIDKVLSKKIFSQVYGSVKSSKYSTKDIPKFIDQFQINMREYEEGPFKSFNDFFIRKFKPGMRNFSDHSNDFSAPAEGRYLAFANHNPKDKFPIKGQLLTAKALLQDDEKARLFDNGPVLIARLCPTDYHRFHYPDSGTTVERYTVSGKLHSVNPIALNTRPDIFISNERCVSILKTENFGYLAYIEVGAIFVGKIVQTTSELDHYKKGQEKGYFLFGGSTVILLGEPGCFKISEDILENSKKSLETFIQLGDTIAQK